MTGIGWAAHRAAIERLQASYDALPVGAPVRLAKKTTNLFRPRERARVRGLDVSGLGGVIEVDPAARTAEVQGMCTYEDLVAATLPHGLIPLVVPQLRTITLGGAVTGLGIEATSFRNGLPHESVLEMDVLTGAGEIVTTRPGEDLFDTFPNSYGSLGYATRLRIELEPVPGQVALRHVRFDDFGLLAKAIAEIVESGEWHGERIDGLDGVVFEPGEAYLTLARWDWVSTGSTGGGTSDGTGKTSTPFGGRGASLRASRDQETSDYTGQQVYFRSLQQREIDQLTMHDYLWRWDTDWFWCSRAFGAQNPRIRRFWPRRWRRSDVYMKLVALDRRFGVADRLDRRAGRPQAERVVQDVEIPVDRLEEFLAWFDAEVGMRPVWLCPLRIRGEMVPEEVAQRPSRRTGSTGGSGPNAKRWPTYPLAPGTTYVNVGFWGAVNVGPEAPDAPRNRAIETKVHELGGHKSLYSEAFYDRDTFDQLYDGPHLATVKKRYDPDDRLTSLYDKAVKRQ